LVFLFSGNFDAIIFSIPWFTSPPQFFQFFPEIFVWPRKGRRNSFALPEADTLIAYHFSLHIRVFSPKAGAFPVENEDERLFDPSPLAQRLVV